MVIFGTLSQPEMFHGHVKEKPDTVLRQSTVASRVRRKNLGLQVLIPRGSQACSMDWTSLNSAADRESENTIYRLCSLKCATGVKVAFVAGFDRFSRKQQ